MKSKLHEKNSLNFDALEVILNNQSVIDSKSFLTEFKSASDVINFLNGYGIDINNPIEYAEMFGQFQEAMLFLRKNFLKEGNPDGLDLEIPSTITGITNVVELFLLSGSKREQNSELGIWAGIILKVMHTLIHVDKDLRQNYFNIIQTQIFDRYYRFLDRIGDKLYLKSSNKKIPIVEFQTKSKKTRESVVIKLLHKKENVAEELFDRIGIRIITESKYDCLRVVNFLHEEHIITPHNIKPSRSHNTIVDFPAFKIKHEEILREVQGEEERNEYIEKMIALNPLEIIKKNKNKHTLEEYKAIHFTCRQLISYTNPFYFQFDLLKKETKDKDFLSKLNTLDTSNIAKDLKFFYPYEVQITDKESHEINTVGESSHQEYKKSQLASAMNRLFAPLINP